MQKRMLRRVCLRQSQWKPTKQWARVEGLDFVWTGGYNVSTKEARTIIIRWDGSAPDPDFIEDIHLGGETEMGNEVSSNGSGVMSLVKKILVPFFNTFNMDKFE